MRLNRLPRMFGAFVLLAITGFLSSCTNSQMQYVMDNYGYENAYIPVGDSYLTLKNCSAYYYTGNISGDYLTSAQWSIVKANSSSSNLNIGTSSVDTSNFRFYMYNTNDGYPAQNSYAYSNYQIYASFINYNQYYMTSYSLDQKKHVAIHEMGHTLGLDDINADDVLNYTVMWHQYGTGFKTFTDYQDFDLENIHWQYGE